jgi:hypothetical protein
LFAGIGILDKNSFYINKNGFSTLRKRLYPQVYTLFAGIGILDKHSFYINKNGFSTTLFAGIGILDKYQRGSVN